jgi:hypothetical protein
MDSRHQRQPLPGGDAMRAGLRLAKKTRQTPEIRTLQKRKISPVLVIPRT